MENYREDMHLERMIYPLEEAAKIAKCQPSDLIHAGAIGKIKLLIDVPKGAVMRLLKECGSEKIMGNAVMIRIPNLLAMGREDCFFIELNGEVMSSKFPLGFSYNLTTGIRCFRPSECDAALAFVGANEGIRRDPRRQWSAWCIQAEDFSVQQLKVVQKRIKVMKSELCRLLGNDDGQLTSVQENAKLDSPPAPDYTLQGSKDEEILMDENLSLGSAEPDSSTDDVNANSEMPPGTLPNIAIGKLAIKAAWEIECKTGRSATADDVMARLQEWAEKGDCEYLHSKFKSGVKWIPKRTNNPKVYSLEACGKALERWQDSRHRADSRNTKETLRTLGNTPKKGA